MINDHTELRVYRHAFELAIRVHEAATQFPSHERNRLTDQIIRSSRSPCASIAEAWRKRRYPQQFIHKIIEAEAEAAETRDWLEFDHRLSYLDSAQFRELNHGYQELLIELVHTRMTVKRWSNFERARAGDE